MITPVFYVVKETYRRGVDNNGKPTHWLHSRRQAGPFVFREDAETFRAGVACAENALGWEETSLQEGMLYHSADDCRVWL